MTIEQLSDRFDRYGALWLLCSRWHSGRWGRGYRLLGQLTNKQYKPSLSLQQGRFETEQQRRYYKQWLSLRDTL